MNMQRLFLAALFVAATAFGEEVMTDADAIVEKAKAALA